MTLSQSYPITAAFPSPVRVEWGGCSRMASLLNLQIQIGLTKAHPIYFGHTFVCADSSESRLYLTRLWLVAFGSVSALLGMYQVVSSFLENE